MTSRLIIQEKKPEPKAVGISSLQKQSHQHEESILILEKRVNDTIDKYQKEIEALQKQLIKQNDIINQQNTLLKQTEQKILQAEKEIRSIWES
jgi:chromosome condensin MukBEF ATPase and DNA-binding subunit MukB